jgi:diadenosine tetraphosphate (Ap4A) HIT family hydrolase
MSTSAPVPHPDCLACQILAGTHTVPGGTIAENDWWVADHCLGPYGLGSVVIKTRTHRENLGDLSVAEAAALGPFMQQISVSMTQALGAARVYVSLWVDQPPYHVHFVLQPRYPDNPQELGLKGLELQVFRTLGQPPAATDMAIMADRIRTYWQRTFAPLHLQGGARCPL